MSDFAIYREAPRFFSVRDRWMQAEIVAVVMDANYQFHGDHGGRDLLPEWDETRIMPLPERALLRETARMREYGVGQCTYTAHRTIAVGGVALAERGYKKDIQYGRPPFLVPIALKTFLPIHCASGDMITFTWDGGIKWEMPDGQPRFWWRRHVRHRK